MASRKKPAATEVKLAKYEGREVIATAMRVVKAGDGLSAALDLDPAELRIGERGYVILEWEVTKIDHKQVTPASKALVRTHTLTAQRAMIVDGEAVARTLDEHEEGIKDRLEAAEEAERLRLAEEAEAGR